MSLKKVTHISPLIDQFKGILSFKLIISSKSILEKLFWFFIAFGGTAYILYIIASQFIYWNENPTLITKGKLSLSDIKPPAITFCHKGVQKYSLLERLGNFMDPGKGLPIEIINIRNEAIKAKIFELKGKFLPRADMCYIRNDEEGQWVHEQTLINGTSELSRNCQVMHSLILAL